jgi:thiol-disulfide isomerase/thioredoxin
MKKILIAVLFPLMCFCKPAPKTAVLNGNISLSEPMDWVYISYTLLGQASSDSARIINGKFSYSFMVNDWVIAVVEPKRDKPAKEKEDPILLFITPGSSIQLAINGRFNNYLSKGSQINDDYQQILRQRKPYLDSLDSMYTLHNILGNEKKRAEMILLEAKIDETKKSLKKNVYLAYLKNHFSTPVSLYALQRYSGNEIEPAIVEPLYNKLALEIKDSPSGREFKEEIELAKNTAIGAKAPDFVMNDTLNKPVSLSSFIGKYVLLDFWASWCGPCRGENPMLVKMYRKYAKNGFTILSVSLDKAGKKADWVEAIKEDSLTWTHVSELNYFSSKVIHTYGIDNTGLPYNFLIDPTGKIIAKNLRQEKLEKELANVFNY